MSLAITLFYRLDQGLDWITNRVLAQHDHQSVEYMILKVYFRLCFSIALLLLFKQLLTKALGWSQAPHVYLFPPGGHQADLFNSDETSVDVYVDLKDLDHSLDSLLNQLRSLVDDHPTALGLWHRKPALEFHFYLNHHPQDDELIKPHHPSQTSSSQVCSLFA